MGRFDDKVVVITGAGSGFGAAMARHFSVEGASLVLADINADTVAAVAADLPRAVSIRVDVTNRTEVAAMIELAETTYGGLDVLINNAGLAHRAGPIEDLPEEEFDRVYAINVKGVFNGVQFGIPALRRRGGGVIINTASIAAVAPRPGATVYNSSKGAVTTMTKGLAVELAPSIRVNALMPVAADTDFFVSVFGRNLSPSAGESLTSSIPMGRLCQPDDVAAAAVYLASDDAAFLTGVCLPVDGGRSI